MTVPIIIVLVIASHERRCDAWFAEMSRYAWRAAATIIWQAPESRGRISPPPPSRRWDSMIANQDCLPAAAC